MEQTPFQSGAYRPEEDKRNQPDKKIEEIVDNAIKRKRFKKTLHQNYDKPGSIEQQRFNSRQIGEKPDA